MPRGGRRPGAPKGNMNNLKHGAYSRQFAEFGILVTLPNDFDVVAGDVWVGGDDRQTLGLALGDEQAIEGVAVVVRKRAGD
jgi:hypothetical protein